MDNKKGRVGGGGKGKGKGKGEEIREMHFYREANGAIKKKVQVMALDRDNKWKAAEILEVRDRVYLDSDDEVEPAQDTKDVRDKDAAEKQNGHHRKKEEFEYYCHILELERRNDRWLTEDQVRIDPDLVESRVAEICLLYTSPSPRDRQKSRMPSSA